ncbi:MAG TPA: glycosyltransferase family 4 protein [Candidatus Angelobacter sp.]|nr:glycosyltransferase family 4 protein [Candidatus Angelobacter sp.]
MREAYSDLPTQREIVIGPESELHPGAHWSLIDEPPPEYRYRPRRAAHVFAFKQPGCSPYRHFHFGEYLDFGDGDEIVHSSRWPVLRRRSWLVDMDDFNYPVLIGKHILDPEFRAQYPYDPRGEMGAVVRLRMVMMLAAYLHSSCKGLLFRSEYALTQAKSVLSRSGLNSELEAISRKAAVLYPAHRPCSVDQFARKWRDRDPLQVVFCGRDFETKNGRLALSVMQRLRQSGAKANFTYIGDIAEDVRTGAPFLLEGIQHYSTLSRHEVLEVLRCAHILFHPSKFEGFGNVLLEAMAAGMAVVCAVSPDIAHLPEFFSDGGASVLDRNVVPPDEEEEVFYGYLFDLAAKPELSRQKAQRNFEATSKGKFSLANRDRTLVRFYEAALRQDSPPLQCTDLPCEAMSFVVFGPAELAREEYESRKLLNVWDGNFLL